MEVKRDRHLDRPIERKRNGSTKAVTGIRQFLLDEGGLDL